MFQSGEESAKKRAEIRHDLVPGRVLDAVADRREVGAAALDLQVLSAAPIAIEEAALRLGHEVEPLLPLVLHDDQPVRLVATQRRGHPKRLGQLRVELYLAVGRLELRQERPLDVAVDAHPVRYTTVVRLHELLQVGLVLLAQQVLRHIEPVRSY